MGAPGENRLKMKAEMKLIAITALSTLLFFECKKGGVNQDASVAAGLWAQQESVEHLTDTTQITDNSFILRAENDLTLERFRSIYKPQRVNKEVFQNEYEPEKKDTLISYHHGGDSISFYIAPTKAFPFRLVLTSDKVIIDNYIRVGVAKDMFIKNFKVSELSDTTVVEDMARFSSFTFYFRKDRLSKIVYQTHRIE